MLSNCIQTQHNYTKSSFPCTRSVDSVQVVSRLWFIRISILPSDWQSVVLTFWSKLDQDTLCPTGSWEPTWTLLTLNSFNLDLINSSLVLTQSVLVQVGPRYVMSDRKLRANLDTADIELFNLDLINSSLVSTQSVLVQVEPSYVMSDRKLRFNLDTNLLRGSLSFTSLSAVQIYDFHIFLTMSW